MRRDILFLLIVPLAGCAAAVPGYSPDGPPKLPAMLTPFKSGSVDHKGHYQVSEEERALTCPKLTGSMQIIMERLKDSPNTPRASLATQSMQTVSKPFAGDGANLDVDQEVGLARARLHAYNDLLAEKKCKTLDINGV